MFEESKCDREKKIHFCSELERKEELKEERIMAKNNEEWQIDDELWPLFRTQLSSAHNLSVPPMMLERTFVSNFSVPPMMPERTSVPNFSVPPMIPERTSLPNLSVPPMIPERTSLSNFSVPPMMPEITALSNFSVPPMMSERTSVPNKSLQVVVKAPPILPPSQKSQHYRERRNGWTIEEHRCFYNINISLYFHFLQ